MKFYLANHCHARTTNRWRKRPRFSFESKCNHFVIAAWPDFCYDKIEIWNFRNTKQKFNFCNNLQIFRKFLSFWVWFSNKLQEFTHNSSNSTSNKNSTAVSGAALAIRSHSSKNALIPFTSLDDFVLMILQTWGVMVVKWSRNFGFSIWKINFLQQWIKFSKWPVDDFCVNRCPEEYKEPKSKQWTQKKTNRKSF